LEANVIDPPPATQGSELARHWSLDPSVVQLNHGSFGAAPTAVLDRQTELRRELEADPTGFFLRRLPELAERALAGLGAFVGADTDGLAFVPNATAGVNTVLRSVPVSRGDEVLVTDHEYPACRNAAEVIAAAHDARVVIAEIPFPVPSADTIVDAVVSRIGPRTRLLLVDHVTSPTGLVLPLEAITSAARERGVPVLVDGAHAPGMVDLDIASIGVDFYTGNCHKWLCAPKGAGFLWVSDAWRDRVRPLVVSHGAFAEADRFRREFDWTGTDDPTARLCVPDAVDVVAGLVPGGWPEVRGRNRGLALAAREVLCDGFGIAPPAPTELVGSMAAVPIPAATDPPVGPFGFDPLQDELYRRFRIEVPVITWLPGPGRVLRVSGQLYNRIDQVEYLAGALKELLPES
jgi:isopenicillin-N epimerase